MGDLFLPVRPANTASRLVLFLHQRAPRSVPMMAPSSCFTVIGESCSDLPGAMIR
jgi:hypothetical protein